MKSHMPTIWLLIAGLGCNVLGAMFMAIPALWRRFRNDRGSQGAPMGVFDITGGREDPVKESNRIILTAVGLICVSIGFFLSVLGTL